MVKNRLALKCIFWRTKILHKWWVCSNKRRHI